jgi:hypothetical protein
LSTLFPYISKRVVELNAEDMKRVLVGSTGVHYVNTCELEEKEKFLSLASGMFYNNYIYKSVILGSVVLQVKQDGFSKEICAWMGQATVSAFITREEKIHLLNVLGYDTSELQIKAQTTRKEKAQKMQMRDMTERLDNTEDGAPIKEEVKDVKMEDADESVAQTED